MLYVFLFLACIFLCQFLYSIKYTDNSIVDIFWGISFVVLVWWSYAAWQNFTPTHTLLTFLICVWGLRLGLHIFLKKRKELGKEDFRYRMMRKSWKYPILRGFLQVFCLQYALACCVAGPLIFMNLLSFQGSIFLSFLWSGIAVFGLIYEIMADTELAQFMRTKKKWDILTQGLRKYHRYPQYFWESMFWVWVSIITLQATIFALVSPLVMFLLLRYVSGVPFLEHRYKDQKNFQEYSKTTPIFFPKIK